MNTNYIKFIFKPSILIYDTLSHLTYITIYSSVNKTYINYNIPNTILIFPFKYYFILSSKYNSLLKTIINSIYLTCLTTKFNYILKLNITGIGYKFLIKENYLYLFLGYSHLLKIKFIQNIKYTILNNGKTIYLEHNIKYILGNIGYLIGNLKKVEPYKGKGINNIYKQIKLKLGKIKNIKK